MIGTSDRRDGLCFRVLNVLRYWINNHYDDFKKDPGLLAAVDTFIQDVSENKKWKNYCGSIRKSLINQAEEIKKKPEIIHTTDAAKIEWHLAVPGEEASYNLLSVSVRHIHLLYLSFSLD